MLLINGSESQRVRAVVSDLLDDLGVLVSSLRGVLKTSLDASEPFLVLCSFLPEDLVNGMLQTYAIIRYDTQGIGDV